MSIDSLVNVLLIVFGFGMLIGIHELGHFLAAKWSRIRTNVFAIGMGPVVVSWRGGIGFALKSTSSKVIAKCGKDAPDMSDKELQEYGISETEYSLRLLPLGGFVSMLGQEDGKPDAISEDPRSYNKCPIAKRMVVVSAGVIMNLILAGVLFLICFQVGVNFEAPVIGFIIPDSPAAKAISLGASSEPLQPGDTIVSIDGSPVNTFTDVQIAGAMVKPGMPLEIEVQRENLSELLTYSIHPKVVTQGGLLELGLYPSNSLTLRTGKAGKDIASILQSKTSPLRDIDIGMKMVSADESAVGNWIDFDQILQASNGEPIHSMWERGDDTVVVDIPVLPSLTLFRLPAVAEASPQQFEHGLLGLSPLAKVASVLETGPNGSILQENDVILKAGSLEAPRMGQLRATLVTLPNGPIDVMVKRDGRIVELEAQIANGMLGVILVDALDVPKFGQPLQEVLMTVQEELVQADTPVAGLQLLGGSEIISINDHLVTNWAEIRRSIANAADTFTMVVQNPTGNHETTTVTIELSDEQHQLIAALGWNTMLQSQMFEPVYITRSSGGNPIMALRMGFDETVNMVVMTYLTIDRLFRRSVGVEQLRGPIGIVHIGSRIADRGISYLLFFLAIISVNLAVLNFLPLPIVDGGLFLYLIYEKLFGKPPSMAFQNVAAMLGLGLIGMLFVVTFYNDIMRLVG